VLDLLLQAAGRDQRLARDAADVEADAADLVALATRTFFPSCAARIAAT